MGESLRLGLSFRWNELAGPFRVSSVMGIVGGAYLAYSVPLWLITGSLFFSNSGSGLSADFFSIAALFLYFFVLVVSIGGAISLLVLPMSDGERGILSLFVTVCSFVPILFLGFEALYWILRIWEFALVAVVWIILLFMTAKVLRPAKSNSKTETV